MKATHENATIIEKSKDRPSEELKTEMAICVYESLLKDINEQEQAEKPDKPTLVWPVQPERFKEQGQTEKSDKPTLVWPIQPERFKK